MSFQSTVASPSGATYPTLPDLACNFEPLYLLLEVTSGGDAYVSLDGINDAKLIKAADTSPTRLDARCKKVWVRRAAAGTAASVNVGAYTL